MDVPSDFTALDTDIEPLPFETIQRDNDSGGTTGEDLGNAARLDACEQFSQADGVLNDRPTGVTQHADDGAAGGALENRAGQTRGAHRPVGVNHHDVHAAELFEILLQDIVEKADLITTLYIGLPLRKQGGGVVTPGLGRTRASTAGTVVFSGDPDGDGLEAIGEVGARGRGDDVVVNDLRRAHPQEGLRGEGEGT